VFPILNEMSNSPFIKTKRLIIITLASCSCDYKGDITVFTAWMAFQVGYRYVQYHGISFHSSVEWGPVIYATTFFNRYVYPACIHVYCTVGPYIWTNNGGTESARKRHEALYCALSLPDFGHACCSRMCLTMSGHGSIGLFSPI